MLSLSLALGGTHLWLLGVLVTACSVVPAEGRGGEREGGREGGRERGREVGREGEMEGDKERGRDGGR